MLFRRKDKTKKSKFVYVDGVPVDIDEFKSCEDCKKYDYCISKVEGLNLCSEFDEV